MNQHKRDFYKNEIHAAGVRFEPLTAPLYEAGINAYVEDTGGMMFALRVDLCEGDYALFSDPDDTGDVLMKFGIYEDKETRSIPYRTIECPLTIPEGAHEANVLRSLGNWAVPVLQNLKNSIPPIGSRFVLVCDVDKFPHFIAPKGSTGTVVHIESHAFWLELDEYLTGAEEWSNQVEFADDWETMVAPLRQWSVDDAITTLDSLIDGDPASDLGELLDPIAQLLRARRATIIETPVRSLPTDLSRGERVLRATNCAEDVFWAAVVKQFPEITTGDFDPLDATRLNERLRVAVGRWFDNNTPAKPNEHPMTSYGGHTPGYYDETTDRTVTPSATVCGHGGYCKLTPGHIPGHND